MIILKYTTFEKKDGTLLEDVAVPTDIPKESVHSISPMVTDYGAFYKNVTVLEDTYGIRHRVAGNYKDWIKKLRPDKIGY